MVVCVASNQHTCQRAYGDFCLLFKELCAIFACSLQKLNCMRLIILSAVALIASLGVSAQRPIRFDEALQLTLENSALLKGQSYDVAVAMYERQAARGLYFPKVEIAGAYMLTQRDININLNGEKRGIENSAQELIKQGVTVGLLSPEVAQLLRGAISPLLNLDWRYTIQKRSFGFVAAKVSMPIYAGGRIRVANRVAALRLMAEEYRMDATMSNLMTTLVERYYGVVLLQYATNVRQTVVNAMRAHLEDAKAMEAAGVIARSVVLEVEYRLAEAQKLLLGETHKLEVAKRALKATMNVDFDTLPIDNLFVDENILPIEYYIDSAVNLNPELQGAELNVNIAKEGVRMARAEMLPTVGVMGEGSLYSYNLTSILPRWVIGVEANVLLFNGLNKAQMLKAAKSRVESVNMKIEKARDDISLLVEQEYYNVVNSLSDIMAAKHAIALAESYYNSAYEGFREGVVAASALLDAEVERAASMLSYLNSEYDYCLALARLLEVSGLSEQFVEFRDRGEMLKVE